MHILGHRGASALAPENTLPAFEAAITAGADGVELDVQRCRTGELVVCHDEELTRLAGVGWELRRTPWSDLRTLDVGSRLGFAPARIPLLEEVLESLPRRMIVNVEIKCERVEDEGLSVATVKLVKRMGQAGRVVFSSFNPLCLLRVATEDPGLERALLLDPDRNLTLQDAVWAPLTARGSIHPHHGMVTEERMRRWHQRGLCVRVWTVNDPARARELRALGVEACITDDPAALRAGLEA